MQKVVVLLTEMFCYNNLCESTEKDQFFRNQKPFVSNVQGVLKNAPFRILSSKI